MRQNNMESSSLEDKYDGDYDFSRNHDGGEISGSENSEESTESKPKKGSIPDDDYRLLQSYFRDVGTESLLSAREECQIATKIRKYNMETIRATQHIGKLRAEYEKIKKSGQVCNCKAKSNGEKYPLQKRINRMAAICRSSKSKESEYKGKFIKSNLRLVISIAKNYMGRGLPLADLIQEGLDDEAAGHVSPLDVADIKRRGRERIASQGDSK